MQQHTIRAAGFAATVDAFAREGEELWFISMLGSQQSVRALDFPPPPATTSPATRRTAAGLRTRPRG